MKKDDLAGEKGLEGEVPHLLSNPSTPFSLATLRKWMGVEQDEGHVSIIDSCCTKDT